MTSRRALPTLSTLEASLLCSYIVLRCDGGQTLSRMYALSCKAQYRGGASDCSNTSTPCMAPILESAMPYVYARNSLKGTVLLLQSALQIAQLTAGICCSFTDAGACYLKRFALCCRLLSPV